jgi:hypothetical protein
MSRAALEAIANLPEPGRLHPAERLVLFALAAHQTAAGCWPSQMTIAEGMNLSERAVRDAIKRLARLGLIAVEKGAGPTSGGRPTDAYLLLVASHLPADDDEQPEAGSGSARRPVPESPARGNPIAEESSATHPPQFGTDRRQDPHIPARTAAEGATYLPTEKDRSEGRKLSGADLRVASEWADAIWRETPAEGQRGTDVRRVQFAIRDAMKAEHDLEAVRRGVRAYYAGPRSGGTKAVSWVIDDGDWQRAASAQRSTAEPVGDIGTPDRPGPRRQRAWMDDWKRNPGLWATHKMGPAPDQPNTRVWPEILIEYGVAPPPGAGAGRQPIAPAA